MNKIIFALVGILVLVILVINFDLLGDNKKNELKPCSEYSNQQSCPEDCSWENNKCKAS